MACDGCDGYRRLTRRQLLGRAVEGGGACFLGLLTPRILYARPDAKSRHTADSIIILWMGGGMSHLDTFDPQPGADHGGPFEAIATAAEGIRISEHLPRIAEQFKHLSLIRTMTSNEADHGRATYLMHTGYPQVPSMQHSTLGSIAAQQLGRGAKDPNLPPYVNVGISWAAGYLGPKYAPFEIGNPDNAMMDMRYHRDVGAERFENRLRLVDALDRSFRTKHPKNAAMAGYAHAYNAALLMMRPETAGVFDLRREPDRIRQAYGLRDAFGQGCLLARRLVENGVRFVEVALGGWDTHQQNFTQVEALSARLDEAVSTLIQDLRSRGLYERTMIVLASEFGRTPRINEQSGRDHYSQCWSAVVGGGGVRGGRIVGRSDKGRAVDARPVQVGELHATICHALGIDAAKKNYSDGRPFRVVKDENAKPIAELFT